MLRLIIGESALEIITDNMINNLNNNHNFINKNFYNRILDKNIHSDIIKKLDNPDKRGRPDIIHFSLLESIDSPLYKNDDLEIYVHTVNNYVIKIGKKLRLPRSYLRFNGLIEKLFKTRKILSNKKSLINLSKIELKSLIEQFDNCHVIGLSRLGKQSSYQDIALKLSDIKNPVLIIGGFSRGQFSKNILKNVNELLSVSKLPLSSHTVISRVLYEYEKHRYNNYY
tara:strand:+ start:115 stop:792 length:678 start_codon:yes stop_codon:yes gene_type:complete